MNEHARDTVEREDESNAARVESKSTSELQWRLEVGIAVRVILHRVMHEDGYELIERNVVKSKQSIDDQIDDGLIIKYFAEAGRGKRWFRWRCVDRFFIRTRGRCELRFEKRLSFRVILIIGTAEGLFDFFDRLLCVVF